MTTTILSLPYSPKDVARFDALVDRSAGPDACHPWTGSVGSGGYGRFSAAGKTRRAHRVGYELHTGEPFPRGLVARHLCHRRDCCNPLHIAPGTTADNSRDMVVAGRSCRGERNGQARLTAKKVRAIRRLYLTGEWTTTSLGRLFRVSAAAVNRVLAGQTWTSVPISPEDQAAITRLLAAADVGKAGSANVKSKLNAGQAREIRRRFAAGGITKTALGREYGVTDTMVRMIVRREAWAWLPDEDEQAEIPPIIEFPTPAILPLTA